MFSWKCVWLFIKMCLRNVIFSENVYDFFSKFVCEISILSSPEDVYECYKMCPKNVDVSPQNLPELFLKCGCEMSKKCLTFIKMCQRNFIFSKKVSEFSSKFVWQTSIFLVKICLNRFKNLSAKCRYFSWNNWKRLFNISNWDSGQLCFYNSYPSAAWNVKILKAALKVMFKDNFAKHFTHSGNSNVTSKVVSRIRNGTDHWPGFCFALLCDFCRFEFWD